MADAIVRFQETKGRVPKKQQLTNIAHKTSLNFNIKFGDETYQSLYENV